MVCMEIIYMYAYMYVYIYVHEHTNAHTHTLLLQSGNKVQKVLYLIFPVNQTMFTGVTICRN